MPMPVAAIVLAAGASRRLGRPKQLLELDGETLLERAIRLAAEAGAAPVIAVLGAHFENICAAIQLAPAISVFNANWEQGIAGSIHTGLRALDTAAPDASAALMMNCDQPRLTTGHLRALLESFATQPTPAMVASAYAGVHGVPAIFPRAVFAHLLALRGDQGARVLLAQPPCPLVAVAFAGGEVDIDLPADLARLEPS